MAWFYKIKIDNGISSSQLGRAIGSLNKLLYRNLDYASSIVWCIVAIEALFCPAKDGQKRKEISEKAKSLFPDLEISEKELKSMYDSRSNFLHGSEDFEVYPFLLWHTNVEKAKKDRKRKEKIEESFYRAMHLFFETLQFMVQSSRHELVFKLSWSLDKVSSLKYEAVSPSSLVQENL